MIKQTINLTDKMTSTIYKRGRLKGQTKITYSTIFGRNYGWDLIDDLAKINHMTVAKFCEIIRPSVFEHHVIIPDDIGIA